MCGRYALFGPSSRHKDHFGLQADFEFGDRYNIAPSQSAPVIRDLPGNAGREVVEAHWGLLPSWVRDPETVAHPINARAETVATKPMFRTAFKRSRILVPAAGFYEWKQTDEGKRPYFIRIRGGAEPMGLAGLLEHRASAEGTLWSYCIVVTAPNALLATIHTRMPVIIDPEDYDAWLDPDLHDPGIVGELMAPYPTERMEAYRVGRAVGNPRAQGPKLVERVPER